MAGENRDAPPADRETTCGGDFASTGGGDGPIHYGTGPLPLLAYEDVEIVAGIGALIGGHTFTMKARGDGASSTVVLLPGGAFPLCGAGIQSVSIDAADASVTWRKTPHGQLLAGTRTGTAAVQPTSTAVFSTQLVLPPKVDAQAFTGSIANATADAVSQAGAITLAIGQLVRYALSCDRTLATPADPLTYISLVGATSGTVYVRCFAGGGPMTGEIRMPAAEKLDIHTANADTVAHNFNGSWGAFSGE